MITGGAGEFCSLTRTGGLLAPRLTLLLFGEALCPFVRSMALALKHMCRLIAFLIVALLVSHLC